jgi:hypothetical protein
MQLRMIDAASQRVVATFLDFERVPILKSRFSFVGKCIRRGE